MTVQGSDLILATLRLRVRHTSSMEPDVCVAEVRLKRDEEFTAIHEFMLSVYAIAHPDECTDVWSDLRPIWRRRFKQWLRFGRF